MPYAHICLQTPLSKSLHIAINIFRFGHESLWLPAHFDFFTYSTLFYFATSEFHIAVQYILPDIVIEYMIHMR